VERKVWVFAEADLWIFREDALGNVINFDGASVSDYPLPLFPYCYAENLTLTASQPTARRAVTGRCRRKLVSLSQHFEEVELKIGTLFQRKATQFNTNDIYNTNMQLRLVVKFYKMEYTNSAPFENDQFDISFAKAKTFSLSGSQAEPVSADSNFEAELILRSGDNKIVPASALIH